MINIGDTVKIIANNGVSECNCFIGTKAKIIGIKYDHWYQLKGIYFLWKANELRKVDESL